MTATVQRSELPMGRSEGEGPAKESATREEKKEYLSRLDYLS